MEQWHVQGRAAALMAGNSQQSFQRQLLPLQHWQSCLPLQRPGSQPPRGGSRVGLGGQWGEDTRGCGSKQQYQSSLEVWPLWARLDRPCQQQNTKDWMPLVWA